MSLFISFEGIDGCGKTTQIQSLTAYLQDRGFEVLSLREPGGTDLGESIRDLLLTQTNAEMSARAELLLFMASRSELCEKLIRPALAQGKVVICDRYIDSSVAYQGIGRGLGQDVVQVLNRFATESLAPDLTFLLDLPLAEAERRRQQRPTGQDRMEIAGDVFLDRVRQAFLTLAEAEPRRIRVLNGCLTPEELQAQIRNIIGGYLHETDLCHNF